MKKEKQAPVIINFDPDGINSATGDIANYIPSTNNKNVQSLIGDQLEIKFQVPLIKYAGYYDFYLKDYLNEQMNLTKYMNKGAAIELNSLPKAIFNENVQKRLHSRSTFKNELGLQKKYLQVIKNNRKRPLIFVVAPVHDSYKKTYSGEKAIGRIFTELETMGNTTVLNFYHETYPDSFFFDTFHLNYEGAKHFSKELHNRLVTLHAAL